MCTSTFMCLQCGIGGGFSVFKDFQLLPILGEVIQFGII